MGHPRGDVSIQINGQPHILRLTLGALATIEQVFGADDVDDLVERLKQPRVIDIILVLHALLIGGGAQLTIEALKMSDVNLTDAARAIGDAFEVLGEAASNDKIADPHSDPTEAPGKP